MDEVEGIEVLADFLPPLALILVVTIIAILLFIIVRASQRCPRCKVVGDVQLIKKSKLKKRTGWLALFEKK